MPAGRLGPGVGAPAFLLVPVAKRHGVFKDTSGNPTSLTGNERNKGESLNDHSERARGKMPSSLSWA